MTQSSQADRVAPPLRGGMLAALLIARCEGLVSPDIRSLADRRLQAQVLGLLVAGALTAILSSPLLWLGGLSLQWAAAPLIAGGLLLGTACALSATGRLDAVLLTGAGVAAAAIASLAVSTGGTSSLCLWLLTLAPAEALSRGRRPAAAVSGAFGLLGLGSVRLAEWAGLPAIAADLSARADALAIGALVLFGAGLAGRALRGRRRSADILTRAAGEAALADDATGEAVLRFSREGTLLQASPAAARLFAGQEAMSETRITQAIHVTDRVRYLQAFAEIRGGKDRSTLRAKANAGMGLFTEVEFDLRAYRDADRRLVSIVGVARPADTASDALAALELTLEAEREGSLAKSRFLASVSHELRTPLNAIIGFSEVLDQEFFGGFEDPRQKEYVGHIRQSGEHLLGVVNGLLDVSKIEAGRYELSPETVSIDELCRTAQATMSGEFAKKGLALELRLEASPGRMRADRRACHQMLLNLLSNAAKFTERGSVTLTARQAGRHLELAVADTGIGIAPADLARVGQPFVQVSSGTTRRYQGTGLGLSLVKGLAELHGGRVAIESEPGVGTTVRVLLPLDGPARIDHSSSSTPRIVALAHARKKPSHITTDDELARRTA